MTVMPRFRLAAVGALAVASVVLLAGCSAQQNAFTDLQGERGASDELPQLADHAYDDLDVSSSRFVGEHEGTSLWLAQGLEDSSVCLVADPGDDDWVVGCGGGGTKVVGRAGSFEIVPDGVPAPEGATQVSENVYAW